MSLRFDIGEFMAAAARELQSLLNDGIRAAEQLPDTPLEWPPRAIHKSDLARLRVALTRIAFERLRESLPPSAAAQAFVEIARTAEDMAELALRRGVAVAGYGEAVGKQRVKEEAGMSLLRQLLASGVTDRDELFERAGLSRRTGFRYLKKISGE